MGTSGAYTGAGGAAGRQVASGLADWLDSMPAQPNPAAPHQLPHNAVAGLLGLLAKSPGSGSGSGGGGAGGGGGGSGGSGGGGTIRAGSGRTTGGLSAAGGRAGAGAYAFATGDRETLQSLGLDYDALRALGDSFEVTRQIVDAVCDGQTSSSLEQSEERYVAATVADWVQAQSAAGSIPDLEDVARFAIASIIAEVLASELGAAVQDRPDSVVAVADTELRDAASVLASQADLTASGPSGAELSTAIEDGIETLRQIYGPQ